MKFRQIWSHWTQSGLSVGGLISFHFICYYQQTRNSLEFHGENNPWHSRCCRSRSPWLTRLVVLLQTDPGRHLVGRLLDEPKCYLCIGYTILRIGYLTSPTLVVFIWATRAHGPSPQPTEYMRPTYSLLTITASNQANAKISTYFAREVPNVFVILARLWWITYPTSCAV